MNTLSLKNVNLKEIVEQSGKLLTARELLARIDYDISDLYIDRFWDNIKDDKWIYLDNELILWMGYKDIRRGKESINKLFKRNFQESDDYKILNNSEFEISEFLGTYASARNEDENRGLHNKQYIVTSPDCFKELCMHVGTSKSKEIKKYYITLEKVFKFYLEYQTTYQEFQLETKNQELDQKNKEIKNIKSKLVDLSHSVFAFKELKKNSYLYIATNKHLSAQSNYKVGITKNLTLRRIRHNNTNNANDKFYYTYHVHLHNAHTVEYMIKHILKDFKNADCNEIYIMKHSFLVNIVKNIVENYQKSISYYNTIMKDYIEDACDTQIPDTPVSTTSTSESEPDSEMETSDIKLECNSKEEILYHNDNPEYSYTCFKNENNKKTFKCLRCQYVFLRSDSLQNHYNRKIKCYEDPRGERIEAIIEQNEQPIIKTVDDNPEYTYYERYNEEKEMIEYYCNRCDTITHNLNILKGHFRKRQVKCYEEDRLGPEEKREHIYINKIGDSCMYYQFLQNGETMYACGYCDYQANQKNHQNIMRHLNRTKKCYHQNYETFVEKDKMKYTIRCVDGIKTFHCYYCQFEFKEQKSIARHFRNAKNPCYI